MIYESLPGFYVTANLYRPNRPGRYPAVLLQAGHTQEGKAEPQWLAANLALKGFVSLAFDPVGSRRTGADLRSATQGAGGGMVGERAHPRRSAGQPRRRVADALLHLGCQDDPSITSSAGRKWIRRELAPPGCSGGGALTTFIGALDSRLKAVIPACFPNSFRLLFTGADPHSEMTLPGHLAIGLDTADFVELSAPTPWLIQATEQDYFTPPGARMMYEEASRWYRLYGAEDRIAFFVGPGGHGTPRVSREAVYRWLIRWLNDGRGDFHDVPVKNYNNYQLAVTRTGRVEDEPGSRKVYQLILDSLQARKKAGHGLGVGGGVAEPGCPHGRVCSAVKVLEEADGEGFQNQHIQFESEPGIQIDARLYVPRASGKHPAVLLLAGKLSDLLAGKMAEMGRVVLVLEPRHSVSYDDRRPYVGDWLANTRADQIGVNLPGRRARDILRGVDLLCARKEVDARLDSRRRPRR